jgi:hydroxyacylglutathione hydrolase
MFFRRVQTPAIAQLSYVLGGGDARTAIVVDPRRDVAVYLRLARDAGLAITHVLVTHRQEDFVLGARALCDATGAKLVTGAHDRFGESDVRLGDGDELDAAGVRLRALRTPGHTPESTCYAIFVPEAPRSAYGVFTGDTLFAGATGRTDLVDAAKAGEHAELLWDAAHDRLLPLGDQALIFPAHGPGSICGRAIAPRPETTLGLERVCNPVFTTPRDAFARAKADERVPRPPYFGPLALLNARGGAPLARDLDAIPALEARAFWAAAQGGALVIDARSPEAFAGGHLPGALSIVRAGLGLYAGWVVPRDARVLLVLDAEADAPEAATELARIGLDGAIGVLAGGFAAHRDAGLPVERTGTITPAELRRRLETSRGDTVLLDVREAREVASGAIEGARAEFFGDLPSRLPSLGLRPETPVVVTCSVGQRASLAVSLLARGGHRNVHNLLGGVSAWRAMGLPLVAP